MVFTPDEASNGGNNLVERIWINLLSLSPTCPLHVNEHCLCIFMEKLPYCLVSLILTGSKEANNISESCLKCIWLLIICLSSPLLHVIFHVDFSKGRASVSYYFQ